MSAKTIDPAFTKSASGPSEAKTVAEQAKAPVKNLATQQSPAAAGPKTGFENF